MVKLSYDIYELKQSDEPIQTLRLINYKGRYGIERAYFEINDKVIIRNLEKIDKYLTEVIIEPQQNAVVVIHHFEYDKLLNRITYNKTTFVYIYGWFIAKRQYPVDDFYGEPFMFMELIEEIGRM